jgi:hypothetical protein
VGGKPVDVTSSVEGSQKATFEVGSVTLGLGVASDDGAVAEIWVACAQSEAWRQRGSGYDRFEARDIPQGVLSLR